MNSKATMEVNNQPLLSQSEVQTVLAIIKAIISSNNRDDFDLLETLTQEQKTQVWERVSLKDRETLTRLRKNQ